MHLQRPTFIIISTMVLSNISSCTANNYGPYPGGYQMKMYNPYNKFRIPAQNNRGPFNNNYGYTRYTQTPRPPVFGKYRFTQNAYPPVFNPFNYARIQSKNNCNLCDNKKNPVCGSDGQTYINKCKFNCINANKFQNKASITRYGACLPQSVPKFRADYDISLDSEELAYIQSLPPEGRPEALALMKKSRTISTPPTPTQTTFNGTTTEETTVPIEIITTRKRKLTLSTTIFKFYKTLRDRTLHRFFKLVDDLPVLEDQSCESCERVYAPVCASDDITYVNACRLKCANLEKPRRKRARIVRYGPCLGAEVELFEFGSSVEYVISDETTTSTTESTESPTTEPPTTTRRRRTKTTRPRIEVFNPNDTSVNVTEYFLEGNLGMDGLVL